MSTLRAALIARPMPFAAAVLVALLGGVPASALTATPTPGPTPQATGDLGTKVITGRVVDGSRSSTPPIAGASVEYAGRSAGTVTTNDAGEFAFSLFLHDTDNVSIQVSALGFTTVRRYYSGVELWFGGPLTIAVTPLSGTVTISPLPVAVLVGCEADAVVTIATDAEPLTISDIRLSNGYSQGDYGTGFTWDLSGIDLPVTLPPGGTLEIPVHYSAAGQEFPSRLTVQIESTARNPEGQFAVPFRGRVDGCGTPTPTPTPDLLGTKTVTGFIYDASVGVSAGIQFAIVRYRSSLESGVVATDASGHFTFDLMVEPSDLIFLEFGADGYVSTSTSYRGRDLWELAALPDVGLSPMHPFGWLGDREIRGRVYARADGSPIAGATVSYADLDRSIEGNSGSGETDAEGRFAFTLFLYTWDFVSVSVAASGFVPASRSTTAGTLVGAELTFGLAPPSPLHQVRGRASLGPWCTPPGEPLSVTLDPGGAQTSTATDGSFAFDDVADGEYVLRIAGGPDQEAVIVDGRDQDVAFCSGCEAPFTIAPLHGTVGTTVESQGDCYGLHSGRRVDIYFDDVHVAQTIGETGGNYYAAWNVPDATPGAHTVRLFGSLAEFSSLPFVVEPGAVECIGDCDGDARITVDEIMRGVARVLGLSTGACAGYADNVRITDLVAAVEGALRGCTPHAAARP